MSWPAAGTAVPALERRMAPATLVAYGGATWDWHLLHYDRDFAADSGMGAPIVDGQMFGALFAQQLQDWLGDDAFLVRLAFRFRRPVPAGALIRCEGEVAERLENGIRCDLRVAVVEPEPYVAVAPASAELRRR